MTIQVTLTVEEVQLLRRAYEVACGAMSSSLSAKEAREVYTIMEEMPHILVRMEPGIRHFPDGRPYYP